MVPFISVVIPSYIIFSTIGAVFSIIFLFFRMERFKIKFSSLIIYCIISMVFLVICSRLVFLIGIIPTLAKSFSFSKLLFYVFNGGIVFYGGMLGVLLGIKVAAKIRKENAGDFYNFAAPAIPLFMCSADWAAFSADAVTENLRRGDLPWLLTPKYCAYPCSL